MSTTLPAKAVDAINGGLLAHLVTVNADGSPYVRCVWTHAEADSLTIGSMSLDKRYIRNLQRDPRVAISYESDVIDAHGLAEYLVAEGSAEVVEGGGGRALLNRLGKAYIGPDADFLSDPALGEGNLIRVRLTKVTGIGAWLD
ncbi:MAG: putative F420-dependent enzyme [Nocardia sp.]|uniref:pyridoxamine 5'-phosphate oxidase family protein n=1 Tax=Nocardia sp. TaxID=1821 RepID=UPI0026392B8F|nr:pyridoxamine 5'-phosphate oxidase family protein [Nocardia sp.]MCU1647733.1 putative F420-dependent enzyme [Nocardia sp.]